MLTLADILGERGPFAERLQGFAPRPQQQEMAEAVAETIAEDGVLIAEAGTGTGKTFAYLVPALLSGRKVIVSTGTKNLQDQLFHRDLPVVRDALAVPVSVALLKGRANYLCPHRLAIAQGDGRLPSRQQARDLQRIGEWAGRTHAGDIAEQAEVPEDSPVWGLVTSTADNCLGQECPAINDCFVAKARREAQEADLVVVNHHLLFADMSLRDGGFGELLPGANAFILDEAHQLPEVASAFFGTSLSSNQLLELARDTVAEYLKEAGDTPAVPDAAQALEKALADMRLVFGVEARRMPWQEAADRAGLVEAIATVSAALGRLNELLAGLAARGKGLESCARRGEELAQRFALLTEGAPDDHIHWLETHKRAFTLNLTPMEVADAFRGQMEARKAAWIFTSATLAVGDGFEHFAARLGVTEARTERWDSPFDFPRQAVFYVPEGMPAPQESGYTRAVVEAALPVLAASEGRAFLLFTSHRALQEAAELLRGRLDYPLLIQGESPRGELLARFRRLGNAVLLGTGSFWEGVDVRGEALSCVIIDKLPFASPGDPVLQARIEAMRERGGNPFMDYQVPNAVIILKQGVGRLIRDVNDRGALVVCDPRLVTKPYGRIFLASLPPMTRTRRLEVVQRFFARQRQPETAEGAVDP